MREKSTVEEVTALIERLQATYPDAHCALDYETPIQLLVATILSAQCTDERVNQVTPTLFARYATVVDFATADREALEQAIHSTGFFRQKALYIQESSRAILQQHGGEVPRDMATLLTLKGVARKTANVILSEIYNISEGITVDTHVKRLAKRLGLTTESDPVKVERDLMDLIPRPYWRDISHLLIFHGRQICHARHPECSRCPLYDLCPSAQEVHK